MIRLIVLFGVLLALLPSVVVAQQNSYSPIAPLRVGETLLNLPAARSLPHRTWEVRFTHRFSQPINDGDFHSFWGLDSSADIGIGLSYSPLPDLQLTVFRTDVQDDFELAAKYALLRQAPAFPVSVALRGGANWRSEENLDDDISGFAQVIVSRQIARRLELFAVPTYVSNAPLDDRYSFDHAFNVPVGMAYMLQPSLSLIVELVPENTDLPQDVDSAIGWAVGLKRAIGGHFFEMILANTRATHVDQYTTSGFLGGLDAGDIHLGFNIERRFGGRR